MANSVCEVLVTEARLQAPEANFGLGTGAIINFWGIVRGLEDEREIDGIEYEAHPAMAEHQLHLIVHESAKKFQLKKVIVHHRVGFVATGEASLFLQVEAGHRAAAFAVSEWIVDELKARVPIWKRPKFNAGVVAGIGDAGNVTQRISDDRRRGQRPRLQQT